MRLIVKTSNPPKAQENAGDRVVIGVSYASDCQWGSGGVFLDQS